jgi:hypothetical protein
MCFIRKPNGVKEFKKLKISFSKRRERELKDITTLSEKEKL